jgi:hypothetical protein
MEITERSDLRTYSEAFRKLFTKKHQGSDSQYALFVDGKACFKKYGTIGLFAEDSLEVIQALVNCIVAASQSLDGDRQKKQVLNFFVNREYSRHETPEERNG